MPSGRAALANETSGPRIRRSDDELKLERDFQLIVDRVLTTGETDHPLELERRADEDMLAVAGFKSIQTGMISEAQQFTVRVDYPHALISASQRFLSFRA